MARGIMANLMNVNRSVTGLSDESRGLRLPRMNQFPKLLRPAVKVPVGLSGGQVSQGAVLAGKPSVVLPEMTSDVIDLSAGYAVENVKLDRNGTRGWSGLGFSQLLGRMLGSQRTTRP